MTRYPSTMALTVHLELPPTIEAGLLSGQLTRKGSVIQRAQGTDGAGEVIAWLREANAAPSSPSEIGSGLGRAASALQLVGSVASVLNLGTTLVFGIASLRGIKRLEDGKAKVQQTVDAGFFQMAAGFKDLVARHAQLDEKIDQRFDEQVLSKLSSAARDMEVAAPLEPDDTKRIALVANILGRVSEGYENLASNAEQRSNKLAAKLSAALSGRARLDVSPEDVATLLRLRMACSALAQNARVVAEAGHASQAAALLQTEVERLRTSLGRIGKAFFVGKEDAPQFCYDDLLNWYWLEKGITPRRIGAWASRFDPETGSLEGVLEKLQRHAAAAPRLDAQYAFVEDGRRISLSTYLEERVFPESMLKQEVINQILAAVRKESSGGLTRLDENIEWRRSTRELLPRFLDLLDGISEDLDRLEGHAAEYADMNKRGLRVAEYAQRFRVEDVEQDARLLVFLDNDVPVEAPRRVRVRG